MNNKKLLIKEMNKDINKENNYNKIIEKSLIKNNYYKYAVIPICMILVFVFIISINKKEKSAFDAKVRDNNNINTYSNYSLIDTNSIYINEVNEVKNNNAKYRIKNVDIDFDILKNIDIPEELNDKESKGVYLDNIFNNYYVLYKNKKNYIKISFSKDNIPLKDYITQDEMIKSNVNNNEVVIYKYNNEYMVEFIYKEYYFYIKTNYSDGINIIKSIIL